MAWKETVTLKELQEKQRIKLHLDAHTVLLLWHQDKIHAIQSQCPHLKLPLLRGELTDDCAIICPFHKSKFSLKDGSVACWSPWPKIISPLLGKLSKEKNLQIYPTKLEQDIIWIDI